MSSSRARRLARFVLGLAACLMSLAPAASGQNPGATRPEGPLESRQADRDELRRVMHENRIETGRTRPGLALYLSDAGLAFSRAIEGWMRSLLPGFAGVTAPWIEAALTVASVLVLLALIVLLIRRATRRRTRPSATPVAAARQLPAEGPQDPIVEWDAELTRRLAGGDVTGAAMALWWWLATRLVGERADASWTSRELLQRAGRRDLTARIQDLDRMLYGAASPSTGDVQRLWQELREVTG